MVCPSHLHWHLGIDFLLRRDACRAALACAALEISWQMTARCVKRLRRSVRQRPGGTREQGAPKHRGQMEDAVIAPVTGIR
jgi:hypothetical protein